QKPILSILELSKKREAFRFSQTMCDPPAEMCGPLMGNSSGTRYCCANTDSSCCYAGGCGGGSNT
ncbi:hypothetical protein, partial [uncultured Algoriphagus sp.]